MLSSDEVLEALLRGEDPPYVRLDSKHLEENFFNGTADEIKSKMDSAIEQVLEEYPSAENIRFVVESVWDPDDSILEEGLTVPAALFLYFDILFERPMNNTETKVEAARRKRMVEQHHQRQKAAANYNKKMKDTERSTLKKLARKHPDLVKEIASQIKS